MFSWWIIHIDQVIFHIFQIAYQKNIWMHVFLSSLYSAPLSF